MRLLLPLCLMLALTAHATAAAPAEPLTIDRLNSDPALAGPAPRLMKVSPDGQRVTFLRGRDDDRLQLDLWSFELQSGRARRIVDSKALAPQEQLSEAERARRERTRTAGLHGINSYRVSPDGKQLLVPLGQALYLADAEGKRPPRQVASGDLIDPQISPKGRHLSYVRDGNLFVVDLASGDVRQLTHDGGGTVHNAEAEFVAQEEMDETSGYWWAPDDSAIAFKRYDEAPVAIARRLEIQADHADVVAQRYPAAGQPNVAVSLHVVALSGGAPRPVDLGAEADIYLVRCDWTPDAKQLVCQRQARNQQRLDLLGIDAATLATRTVLTETQPHWVNLHGAVRFLRKQPAFVWLSDRSGRTHAELRGLDGTLRHVLSGGDWQIDRLLAVDEAAGTVYVEGTRELVQGSHHETTADQHVYALPLDGSGAGGPLGAKRLTDADGWHDAVFADNGGLFVDTWSDRDTPPQVSVRRADGRFVGWLEHNAVVPGHPYAPYAAAHRPTQDGTLQAADGQTLHYAITLPTGFDPAASTRYPVMVAVYGGPTAQEVQRRWGRLFEQVMAQHGYVVFTLDNRGSSRRERAFTDALFGELGNVEVQDQLAGIDWLARQPYVDARRIGVFGWSYGGYMTLRMLAAGSDRIRAGVAGAPVVDWSLYDTHYTERYLGTPQSNPEGFRRSGVLPWIDGLTSKLLLVHGMADDNVLFANSTQLIGALAARGTQFDLMTYPGEKHGLATPAMKQHMQHLVLNFFDRELAAPGGNAPAPQRAAASTSRMNASSPSK